MATCSSSNAPFPYGLSALVNRIYRLDESDVNGILANPVRDVAGPSTPRIDHNLATRLPAKGAEASLNETEDHIRREYTYERAFASPRLDVEEIAQYHHPTDAALAQGWDPPPYTHRPDHAQRHPPGFSRCESAAFSGTHW